ncbi:trigger factor [SAR202 cluster bacterium AC-647-P02_OGT_505m]|nr:trigger factor [SAR202 cluster bacterium AC-647-P02_OGT_505m]
MKITQDEVVERQTTLHIELDDEDIDPYLQRAYSRVVQRINIPGFRKGKAPRSIIEQYYGRESLLNEILDSMLPELTGKAITEEEIEAVGMPSIDLEGLDPFKFSAVVPMKPDIDLGEYKDIRVERETPSLPEDAIDERIEQLRLSVASWEPVDRSVETGDMVSTQIKGILDDEVVLDENDAVYLVNEDIGRPFPGFSDKLVGLESDSDASFDLDIPEDFPDENLAGKNISFEVNIKDIKERVLPDLNDEFAQSIGEGYESLDDLREEIDKSIINEAETEASRAYRENVIQALLESATIDLPPLLIEHESSHMIEEQERMVTQANMVLDDYLASMGKTRTELEEESRKEAIGRLTRSFVLSALADQEDIDISDNDINDRIDELFSNSDDEKPDSSQTAEMMDYMRRSMRMEQTMERLEDIAEGYPDGKPDQDKEENSDEDDAADTSVEESEKQ